MDIKITKKRNLPNKKYLLLLLIIPLFFIIQYLWDLGRSDFSIDRDALVISEVQRGKYTISVRGTGTLVPEHIQWLSAGAEATVAKLVLKAGNVVKAGDLIVELNNPQLIQQMEEAKWEFAALEAETKAARIAQESELQQQKANVLNAKLDHEHSVIEFNARLKLIKTGAVSELDRERARLVMDQSEQRWLSSKEQLAKMQANLVAQNDVRVARLNKARNIVDRIQQQVNDLQVKATFDSVILEVPLEVGQRVMMGANIAKLAQQGSLIAQLQVPEIQIRDVAVGQRVIVDTRNNKIDGLVSRVDPAVVNGHVQVDVSFSGDLPDDARPDLSVDGEIKITELENALYVNRPAFAQSRSKTAFYRVSKDEKYAERVEVALGYGSVNQIQIMEGLNLGDKIITSDTSRFRTYNTFRIK